MLQNVLKKATSCGCDRSSQMDMVGQRFGRLTVLEQARLPQKRSNGQVNGWRCRCDCGKDIIITRKDLLSGKVLSCGCLLSETAAKKVIDDNVLGFYDGTSISNIKSSKPRKNSESGHRGVKVRMSSTKAKRYVASIMLRGQSISLGTYNTLEEAIAARKRGEEMYYDPLIQQYNSKKDPTWKICKKEEA